MSPAKIYHIRQIHQPLRCADGVLRRGAADAGARRETHKAAPSWRALLWDLANHFQGWGETPEGSARCLADRRAIEKATY